MRPKVVAYLLLTLLVGILALGPACAKPPDAGRLIGHIQFKLGQDSELEGKPIIVQTSGGVVILSCTVENDAQRMAAARYVSEVLGVRQVVNSLQMTPTAALAAAAQEQTGQASSPPPSAAKKVRIPSGTTMAIRLVDAISSETSQAGQTFRATLDSPLSSEGDVALPSGYEVQGHIVDVKSAGKFAGKSELVLQLDRITVGSKSYSIQTDQYRRAGNSRSTNTAAKVGAGAAIGAIIGGIAGGGKGAGIGAAAGGGLGGAVQASSKGQQVKLPSETVLTFTLQSPLTVTPVSEDPNTGRRKLELTQ